MNQGAINPVHLLPTGELRNFHKGHVDGIGGSEDSMSVETWKLIPGYPGYEASTLGRIRSIKEDDHGWGRKGWVLKPGVTWNGRNVVVLCVTGMPKKSKSVHGLIAATFLGPRPYKYEINHKDGNPLNNAVDNLEYVTSSQNKKHAFAMGLNSLKGERHNQVRLNLIQVRIIRRIGNHITCKAIGEIFGVSESHVWGILKGKTWNYPEAQCSQIS